MSHLEQFVAEYPGWKGYLVRQNIKVGPLGHGGWEMELDVVGFHPSTQDLVHYEPSIDALNWAAREKRYKKSLMQAEITFERTFFLGFPKKNH